MLTWAPAMTVMLSLSKFISLARRSTVTLVDGCGEVVDTGTIVLPSKLISVAVACDKMAPVPFAPVWIGGAPPRCRHDYLRLHIGMNRTSVIVGSRIHEGVTELLALSQDVRAKLAVRAGHCVGH